MPQNLKVSFIPLAVAIALSASPSHANTAGALRESVQATGASHSAALYLAPPSPVARKPPSAPHPTAQTPSDTAPFLHAANEESAYPTASNSAGRADPPFLAGEVPGEAGGPAPADKRLVSQNDGWMERAASRIGQIWSEGNVDLYLTGYAWHNRSTYSRKELRGFNETSYGGGIGRSIYDEDGDWHALYVMGFKDSFRHFQPMAGYGFQKIVRPAPDLRLGYGFTAFMTSRRDMFGGVPFPGILPLVSVGFNKGTLFATYIPGKHGAGNVAFLFGKWQF